MALSTVTNKLRTQSIGSSFDQLLYLDSAAGLVEATLKIVSTDTGHSAIQIDDERLLVQGVDTSNAAAFEVKNTGGTSIFKVNASTADVNIPVNIGLRFGDGNQHIETNNVDFTITSDVSINLNSPQVDLIVDTNFVTTGGTNGMSIDGTTFSVDGFNNRIGIGTATPATKLEVVGSFTTGLVTIAATDAITAAEHAGRTNLLGEVGGNALVTLTLPDATGTGNVYKFTVSVVNTSSYKFLAPDADNTIDGQIMITDADGTAATSFVTAATTDTIILNGTTSGGGAIGDYIELTDIAANQWAVNGMVTCAAGSNIATMFSATVS
jgi:hypothetical protein